MKQVDKQSPIYKLRHSLAHILAQAVLEMRPEAKLGFGPPVDNGFYYDFDFGDNPVGEEDFKEIEKRMMKIVKEKQQFEKVMMTYDEAVEFLTGTDQEYKIEHCTELVETGKADRDGISFWKNGPFIDMCEGPHLEHTGLVKKGCFRLDKVAGSYWKGSEKNPMLRRIYGLAFEESTELKEYIKLRQLAMQRDHRKLGQKLQLFTFNDEIGSGLPIWLPNGTIIRDELEKWAREMEFEAGYERVSTPVLTKEDLYFTSGHLPYYKDTMFPPMDIDGTNYYMRPMNCPHHHKVFESRPQSYRDLPVRLAEYGNTYRYEKHGSLSGLMRVRAMSMNDAHIYCTEEQVEGELRAVMEMYNKYYEHLRLGDFRARLSLHSSDNEKFVDAEEGWLQSEETVRKVLKDLNIEFEEEEGEAAFYGPKIDVQVKNVLGREETVSTCQLDFVMGERFNLKYKDADGETKTPLIIHRAPLSTHERMVSFLIELYGGAFPTWMSPTQVVIVPIAEAFFEYAHELGARAKKSHLRAKVDDSTDSFSKKVRKAITGKNPNIWIVGEKEVEENSVTWRRYCNEEQVFMGKDKAFEILTKFRDERTMDNFDDVSLEKEVND
ncbi:MAG: threonine--tRNA ligase [Bacteroidia bacterium]|nr:threonine--tRNA ligase [Bacteroidia bacterium]